MCRKKVIGPSYDIGFQCSRSQIKATRVSYMMGGLDLNFRIQWWRAGAKSEVVLDGRQQDTRATTCRKKVIASSYDIGFQCSRSQIKPTRESYMMGGLDLNFRIQG
jgi:hypothetical protein